LADFLRGIGVKLGSSVSFLDDQDFCVISEVPGRAAGRIGRDTDENGIISTLSRAGRNYRCRFKANHVEIFNALFRELAQLSKASHAVLLQTPEQSVIRRLAGGGEDVPERGLDHQQAKQSLRITVAVAGHNALSIHDHCLFFFETEVDR